MLNPIFKPYFTNHSTMPFLFPVWCYKFFSEAKHSKWLSLSSLAAAAAAARWRALNYVSTATLSSHSSAEWHSTSTLLSWCSFLRALPPFLSSIVTLAVEMKCSDGVCSCLFLPASGRDEKWDMCRGSNLRYGNRMTIYAPFRFSYLFLWTGNTSTISYDKRQWGAKDAEWWRK